MGGALAVMLALPMTGMWGMPMMQVSAAGDADDSSASQPETTVTKVQAEDGDHVTLDPQIGSSMTDGFVVENEPSSNGGAHIKTSKIGATVTLTFEGTGVRFYTKRGNGAGEVSAQVDGGEPEVIDEYIDSSTAQFQQLLFEALNLSADNEQHTLILTTVEGERSNFNFDYFDSTAPGTPGGPPGCCRAGPQTPPGGTGF